jgi:hypothetical protein
LSLNLTLGGVVKYLNKFLATGLLLLLSSSLFANPMTDKGGGPSMNCPRPPQGPPGPTGPTGPTGPGGGGADAFAAAFNAIPAQAITSAGYTSINFPTDRTGTPVGITHPVGADNTEFEVTIAGFYFVSWTATLFFNNEGGGIVQAAAQLFVNGTAIAPTDFIEANASADQGPGNISGSVLISLAIGDIITLRAIENSDVGSAAIRNPSINIFKVADPT